MYCTVTPSLLCLQLQLFTPVYSKHAATTENPSLGDNELVHLGPDGTKKGMLDAIDSILKGKHHKSQCCWLHVCTVQQTLCRAVVQL